MRTRNQSRPDDRHRNEGPNRWESSYRDERRPEPFDEFRGYDRRSDEYERPYYSDEDRGFSRNRNWQEDDRYRYNEPSYRNYDNYSRQNTDDRDRRNSYREENDPWYEHNRPSHAYHRDEGDDRRHHYSSGKNESYKGRYYGRSQSPEDLREIRRRYEESRRNSGWTNAYLPTNDY